MRSARHALPSRAVSKKKHAAPTAAPTAKAHPWSTPHADPTPYGRSLATRVAAALASGKRVINTHRDYCGLGLVYVGGEYQYVVVHDGEPVDTRLRFATQKDFVEWLAAQSDDSLHGCDESEFDRGNQRVTRARLEEIA